MDNLLSDLIKYLIEWIIVRPLLATFRFGRFCVTTAARRRRMLDYNRFTQNEYTNKGKAIPALILRIQNGYIRKYNEATTYWAGKALMLKTRPEVDGNPHTVEQPIKCEQWRNKYI